ncbi:hypothetical protein JXM83_04760 [Candidatus Woesearchaeota archaeon]|nr:hypothetical protein [Candidatus Woesearchaeota archaeon]
MIPKITILGTAGDSYLMSKQVKASTGIVLNFDKMQFILDPGPGTIVNLNTHGINVRETTGIILSSNEVLYSNDVNAIVCAMTFDGVDSHGVLIGNKEAMFGTSNEESIVLSKTKKNVERYIALSPEQKVGINTLELKASFGYKRVNDTVEEDSRINAYKIFTSEFSIGYIVKSAFSLKLAEELKDVSILILGVTDSDEYSLDNTMNVNDAKNFIDTIRPNLAIITGYGIKLIKEDPLDIARRLHQQTGIQVIAAKDGLSLTPTNHSKKSKQMNLSGFSKSL